MAQESAEGIVGRAVGPLERDTRPKGEKRQGSHDRERAAEGPNDREGPVGLATHG